MDCMDVIDERSALYLKQVYRVGCVSKIGNMWEEEKNNGTNSC